jgi:carbon starvation protein
MKKATGRAFWLVVGLLGAFAYATMAIRRGEPLNAAYLLVAALCSYAIGYRFYSKWIAARVLMLDDRRATPCEVHDDGKDFVKTNRWIVFGHHFAAISGPGPLVGPVLAAQFGYLPGALWLLIGVTLGGAVQDFVVLFCSLRRDGKSLGQMVKEELNGPAGLLALVAILAILIILLAVLALVVVKALAKSPWGMFTVGATVPIAMFMGIYLRFWRVGKVMEASVIGVACLLLAVWGGRLVHGSAGLSELFGVREVSLARMVIIYGLAASVLPVWLLLAPRDYLSTFMKLGTIFALALGLLLVLPNLHMPALTKFVDGSGPVVAGKIFPFCFITIACGAISGFHTLIASGTTPKLLTRESYARSVGYGAMCLESLVAIMALIAACTLSPGVYFGMNVASEGRDSMERAAFVTQKIQGAGTLFTVDAAEMDQMAAGVKEKTLFNRAGGAATLAAGMATIFSRVTNGRWLDLWYHFAIMFEALFILTTIDAGTRVGRYLLQDMLGQVWRPLGRTGSLGANLLASVLMVAGWGYFLIQGVLDPLGGINSLWPLFGIANQMLAAIALCLGTTIILKMALQPGESTAPPQAARTSGGSPWRSPALALITLLPLIWLAAATMTAGYQKVCHSDPRIGFLAQARALNAVHPALEADVAAAIQEGNADKISAAQLALRTNRMQHFNNILDAAVALVFMLLVTAILVLSVREWLLLLARRKLAALHETPPVWLPQYALSEAKPVHLSGLIALALALAKEVSGEAHLHRAREAEPACMPVAARSSECEEVYAASVARERERRVYLQATEHRFDGINRCC